LATVFGPGFNGTLELAGPVSSSRDAAFNQFLKVAARTPGVASVTPAVTSSNGNVVLATLYPTTSTQAKQTSTLVNDLRHDVIPPEETGTSLQVHVGGVTATDIDCSHVLTDKLPVSVSASASSSTPWSSAACSSRPSLHLIGPRDWNLPRAGSFRTCRSNPPANRLSPPPTASQ
jgi:hypothetical protein